MPTSHPRFIDAASDAQRYLTATDPAAEVTPIRNVAVELNNDGAEFTGGDSDNSLSIRVYYRVVPVEIFS
ncbi:MAG: hypothetical protein O7H41_08405 [Planctomycetota bacterium]|nr:hypothetical protein [Planctomycetota bacterium]